MNEFAKSCKQLRKKYKYETTPDFLTDLRELFVKSLGQPEDMSHEAFEYCVGSGDVLDEHADKLADMVDLFVHDYDPSYGRLEDGDWEYLKDLVNSYALDMDMDTVTYVMQLVVDAGVFH